MNDFEVIDAHVHLYRDRSREVQAHPVPGRRDRDRWGNAEAIVPYMDREGVSQCVALNFYPTGVMQRILEKKLPDGMAATERAAAARDIKLALVSGLRRQNEWLCQLSREQPRIVAGIGVQKLLNADELVEEVECGATRGARTVKMVPGWFHEFPNDRTFWPMYERCAELELPITADTGTIGLGRHQAHPDQDNTVCYGEPVAFTDVLRSFPRLTVVMAHFECAFWDERVEMAAAYPNLMFDISGGFDGPGIEARNGHRALAEADAVRVMRRVGIERFMFGTDGPGVMLQPYLQQVLRLDLSDKEKQMVLADNAKRIYRL